MYWCNGGKTPPALKAEAYAKYQDQLIKDFVAHMLEELAHEDTSAARVVP